MMRDRQGDATDPADRGQSQERQYADNRSYGRQPVDDSYKGPPPGQSAYQPRNQADQPTTNNGQAGDQQDDEATDQAAGRGAPQAGNNAAPPPAPRSDGRPFEYGPYHASNPQN